MKAIYVVLLCFVTYFFLTILFLYPFSFHINDHIIGTLSDPLGWVWNLAWPYHALTTEPSQLFHGNRLYPIPYAYLLTYQQLPLQFIYAPLYYIFDNQVLATNGVRLLIYPLTGLSLFLLLRHFTGKNLASFIGGCMFTFAPFRLPSDLLHLAAIFWTPIAILFLDKYYRSQRLVDLLWCTLFIILQILTAFETGFYLLFSFCIYTLFRRMNHLWKQRKIYVHHGIAFIVFLLVLFPFMYPLHVLQKKYEFKRNLGEIIQFSADPISSYLRSNPENRLYNKMRLVREYNPLPGEEKIFKIVIDVASRVFGENFISTKFGIDVMPGQNIEEKISLKKFFENWNREDLAKPLFPGFITMILGLLGVRFLRKHPDNYFKRLGTIFLWILLFGFIMSLGPVLIIYGHLTYIPLPYLFFYYLLPGFSAIRGVFRFIYMVSFALSVLGCFGYLFLDSQREKSNYLWFKYTIGKYVFAGFILFLILAESWTQPVAMVKIPVGNEIPGVYQWLSKTPINGAIFEIPTIKGSLSKYDPNPHYAANRKMYNDREILYLYYSTYHFKKMVNGVGSFLPPERKEIFKNLYSLPDSSALNYFKDLNIRTFVLHTDRFEPEDSAIWTPENIKTMGFREIFRDGSDIVLCL